MAEPRKLGRYELRRVLGRGAMGVVYEGFDPALGRRVAVKTILKSDVADEETAAAYVARFAREAKAVARLNHPNIVQVYDFGDAGEVAFLVMEHIEGRELRACFEAGERFQPEEAVRIMAELLGALEVAHESGVIHRDIKPANVMLDAQRRVKLADFGVARLLDGSERSRTATMVGTPAFMSPEQVAGARVDRRTDLFSAGIVLYQLLTGEQPFKGEGAWTVARSIVQDEPPRPSTVAETVSPLFDAIINRALAKKPDQRFASAREFAGALQAALAGKQAAHSAPQASDTELEFWRSIRGSTDADEFRLYLRKFPGGTYAELAELKLAKLSSGTEAPQEDDATVAAGAPELSALSEDKARLEAALAQREAEFRKREAELEAEAAARAEEDARREAEEQRRAAEEERARQEAIEAARREAQAELARKEAEFQRREADARARAEAEAQARAQAEARARAEAQRLAAQARAEAEARAREEAKALARAKEEAEAKARQAAEERRRHEADAAKREAELRKQLAATPRPKQNLAPLVAASFLVAFMVAGGWYWYSASREARLAELTAALEAATKAAEQLASARQQQESALRNLELAREREEEARKAGDLAKLKEAQEAAKRAEAEAAKQAELVKQKEAEKLAADKAATARAATDKAAAEKLAAEKAAAEKAAAEKTAAEKAAVEKAAAERLAAEKAVAEKAAAEKAAAEKLATAKSAEKTAAPKPAAKTGGVATRGLGLPKPGERWVYSARDLDKKDHPFGVTLEVQSAGAAEIAFAVQIEGKPSAVGTQKTGRYAVTNFGTGLNLLSPYLLFSEKLQAGDLRAFDAGASTCGSFSCQYWASVAGRERISTVAGSFDAWKVVVQVASGSSATTQRWELRFWFDEATGVLAKYQRRTLLGSSSYNVMVSPHPEIDMELVSRVSPGAQQVEKALIQLPAVGDRWVYQARDADHPDKTYDFSVEAQAVTSSSVQEIVTTSQGLTREQTHQKGVARILKVAPGQVDFVPYLPVFETIQPGMRWPKIDYPRCANSSYCTVTVEVAGKERVSIGARRFDTWKVVLTIRDRGRWGSMESGSLTYWYADEVKRMVKFQSRFNASWWLDPNLDIELLSYVPSTAKSGKAAASNDALLEKFIERHGRDKVVPKEPPNVRGAMRFGESVFVNDGSCGPDEIREVWISRESVYSDTLGERQYRCISLKD
jgi:serine/threonine-protein kinase